MPSLRIPRRSFLTGLAGASVALPFLEAMLPRNAWAAVDGPCRYVGLFGGVEQRACIPSGGGSGYTMPSGFASLEPVRDHLSIVSGLAVPNAPGAPGGKANPHHGNIMMPVLTGCASTDDNYGQPYSASADQIVAEAYGDTYFRSLEFRAQAHGYRGGSSGVTARMAYGPNGEPKIPQKSPQLAYESVFAGFTPPDASAADLEAAEKLRARRLSVLDLVKDRGDALLAKVSNADRQRLDQHFSQIRDLETRLADLPNVPTSGTCEALPNPGADPTPEDYPNTEHGGTTGYANEALRAELFVELIHMAMACDLTRAATLMLTIEQSFMSLQPLFGAPYEMHDITHVDVPNRNAVWDQITSWHASFVAQLIQKLADTPEPTGGTMLDNTAVVYTHSGGVSGHGGSNLAFVVAGVPSRLRMGHHIVQPNGHPAHVYQTVLGALGIDQPFGEVPGIVSGLQV